MTAGTRRPPRLIGRDGERKELLGGLDATRAGRGRFFLLTGDAGIGKTRLVQAVAEEAASAGIPFRWGRCRAAGGAPPYWPWSQILDIELAGPGPLAAPRSALPGARIALFEEVTDVLRRRCLDGGLVVAVEDLHGADEASLRLLELVVRELASCPVLLIATSRHAELRDVRYERLARLARQGRRLRLGGLDDDGVAALLEATGLAVEEELARAVLHATDGNPFFVQELARILLAARDRTGGDPPRGVPLPHDVHQLLRYRLAPVPAGVREVVSEAAVLGEEFDLDTLAAVHDGRPEALGEALAAAVELELLDEPGPGRWSFSHGLLRDAFYEELRPSARVALHGRAGRAMQAQVRGDRRAQAFEVAHHCFQAARGGDGTAAVEASIVAGGLAVDALAFEDAAVLYGRALEALSLVAPVDERRRHAVLVALARCQERAGYIAQATETWRRALRSARVSGTADLLAEAAVGYAGVAASSADVRGVLDEARAAMSSADSPLLARLLARLAVVVLTEPAADPAGARRSIDLGRDLAEEAGAIAGRVGDEETVTAVLSDWRTAATSHPDLLPQRLGAARELLELAERGGDPERVALVRTWLAADLFASGDVAGAAVHVDAAAQEAERVRSPFLVWQSTAERVAPALLGGRLDDAERWAGEALAAGRALERTEVEECFEAQTRRLAMERGRFDEVVERLGTGGPSAADCLHSDLAMSLFHIGRHDDARRLLAEMLPPQVVPRGRPCCSAALAELCWLVGDAERAARLSEVFPAQPQTHVVEAVSGCSLGASARYAGQLAALQGRFDEAEAHFAAAHRLHERLEAPAWLARSRADEARMLIARGAVGDLDRARELAGAAAEAFTSLGIDVHAALARAIVPSERPGESAATAAPAVQRARLLRGDDWAFEYGGEVARLRDSKGVRYLVALLRQPGRELHALDLVGAGGDGGNRGAGNVADAGSVFTPEAKAAFRRRLEDLREELDDATANNDLERAARAQERMDALLAELTAAAGQGGGDRRAASEAERARQSVTRAVKGTVERLAEANPALGLHLKSTVRTGVYSAYVPDPRAPIQWEEVP